MPVDISTPERAPEPPARSRRAIRVGYLVSHPIQYQAPLLRALAREPSIELHVMFLSDFSTRPYLDEGFGASVAWDVPLLEGYSSEFLSTAVPGRIRPWVPSLERRLDTAQLDVLWIHGYSHPTSLRAVRFASCRGIPVMVRGESSLVDHRSVAKRRALSYLFRRADAFLSIGARNRDFYLHFGARREQIHDVPYVVDNAHFESSAAAARQVREDLQLVSGRPVILFAAKLIERKRPLDLLDAVESILAAAPSVAHRPYLLFVGDGELRHELERRADHDSIRVVGFRNQSELPAFYRAADVFVLPSSYETYGLSVNEAMCASCPIVVSDAVGAGADLVEDGVNGYVFPAGDVDALSNRLTRLIQQPALRRRMGEESRRSISRRDVTSAASALVNAVETLVTL